MKKILYYAIIPLLAAYVLTFSCSYKSIPHIGPSERDKEDNKEFNYFFNDINLEQRLNKEKNLINNS